MTARLIDANTVAQMTNFTANTIRRFARQGTIPAYRVGQRIRFDVAEVEAWLAGLKRAAS